MDQKIEIENMITVGTLAEKLTLPVSRLITELMKNGIMATVNEQIDFDTAQIIVDELGLEAELVKQEADSIIPVRSKPVVGEHAVSRPPVVAVMGHVDHGKTSLLDAIRDSHIVKHEAGGITQHISACQIDHNGRKITFLDTPGHEAFAAIREHGAHLTDLALIVIAADDGIKPQTLEAIRFAQKASVKIIVAINKIDKDGADVNRIKQQLSEHNLLPEEWGGETVIVEVSAKTKQGIDNLLEMILLISDVEDLRAETDGPARGLIIEAHTEQGRGPVASALVESGILKRGDYVVSGSSYAKVRNLESPEGIALLHATPSTPVLITGFKSLPEFGDEFEVVISEKVARSGATAEQLTRQKRGSSSRLDLSSNDLIRIINKKNELQTMNVVIKADVQGSLTSVLDSLKALATDEVMARIVGASVGAVSENDIHLAHSSNAIIYAFNVLVPINVKQRAHRDKVHIRQYKVIYELLDDAKTELSNLLAPQIVENKIGRLKVKALFKSTKSEIICGGEVLEGKLMTPALARIWRSKELLTDTAEITNLKRGPQDVKEVLEGEMCGVSLRIGSKIELQEGDTLEAFSREVVERTL